MNQVKSWLFMALLTVLLVLLGNAIAGQGGMVVFFLIALAMNFFSYWYSDKMAIAMTGSEPVTEEQTPDLYALVRKLARAAGLPMPKLYVTPSDQPNAFATGRDPSHAVVAVTTGLLRTLGEEEIEGVLAHELAHVKNRDILLSSLAAATAGAVTILANVAQMGMFYGGGRDDDDSNTPALVGTVLMIILAPIAAMLIQLAISRSREYVADATGAEIAGSPHGLANALLRLENGTRAVPMDVEPAAAHMFIVNPLSAEGLARLFSTHPPIQDRVDRLRTMRI